MNKFAWKHRATVIAGLLALTCGASTSAFADGMQATATFTPSTMGMNDVSEVTIRVVNETGEDFAGPLSTDALPELPSGLGFHDAPNIGDCDSDNGIAAGASCEMTATIYADDPGSYEWSGSVEGYDLIMTSATPLVVYRDPAVINLVSGSDQQVRVGNAYPSPLLVEVTYPNGFPLAGVDVTFTSDPEAVTLSATTVQTDSEGHASVTAIAGTYGGGFEVEASVSGLDPLPDPVYFHLDNIPPPRKLGGAVSYSSASIARGGQATATITLVNTTGRTIDQPISAADMPALPNGLTMVGQFDMGGCQFQNSFFNQGARCEMTATVTSSTLGSYKWTGSGPTNDSLNIYISFSDAAGLGVYGAPAAVSVSEGDDQATVVGDALAPLAVKVTDSNGTAVPGVEVTFTASSTGAGVTAGSSAATTDASGLARVNLTANQTAGDYQIEGTIDGASTPAVFNLANLPGDPASVSIVSGNGQSATVGTAFGSALVAQVVDRFGNAIAGETVTFASPANGAGGTFANNQQTATTGADGIATSATFTANASIGSYGVVASVQGASPAIYSLENIDVAVTAGAATATVAANSSANAITLNLSGGAASTVAVVDAASHGAATASGAAITYTPTAGYSGTDSFTYSATNSAGPSTAAIVTVTVTAPTLSLSPTTLPDGRVGTAYNQTITASGGTAPYSYAITTGTLPSSLNLDPDGIVSGTLLVDGSSAFTITATDSLGATGAQAYSVVIAEQAVTAGAATATVAANSSANPITLNLSGGAASTVAVVDAASHGTATASGAAITYTPTAGYSGTDSFIYSASNSAGTSTAAIVTVTVTAPTLSLSPTTLPDGRVGTAYSQTITASGGTAPYSYAVTTGTLPSSLNFFTDGIVSGTPSVDGSSAFTVTATDSLGATGARAYSVVIAEQAVTAGAATATVAANSSANPITLNLSGGAVATVAVVDAASHGAATASGAAITYTPTAGYSGTDSFTYTASNSAGTSAVATVTVSVTAPTLSLSPTSLPDGRVGTTYSQTITASGGTAPYSYAVTTGTLPSSLNLDTDGIVSGTPSVDGSSAFTVTATDSLGATGAQAYSVVIAEQAVTAGAVTATVAANSSANPITLNLSGGAASTVAVVDAASHGTATASGAAITYTPTAGYSGTDSFTYTATNSAGTSAAAIVTVTVVAPTLSLSPTALLDGRVGTAYNQTITASGGTAPYSYAVTTGALPAGLALATDGTLSGSPSLDGSSAFTVTATDSLGATGAQAYSLNIERRPNTLVFSPAGGALPDVMAGEAYSASISATGGAAPIIYSIASGAMPAGMVLNISTGDLTGPLNSDTQGRYTFDIQAIDNSGSTGTASYSLIVTERKITAGSSEVTVTPGANPTNVNLETGATGGPFTSADVVSVEPANAGTAQIVMGEFAQAGGSSPVGFYLKFKPNPAYSGQVIVRFTLSSSLGTSNPGIVIYNLGYDPVAAAHQVRSVTQGFVQTRQSLVAATIMVPGLLERRMMAAAGTPVKSRLSPSGDGVALNFATSLIEMNSANNAAAGVIDPSVPAFNLWVDGMIMVHNRVANGNRWGSFGMISAGADYLLNENVLIGLSFHYDHMTDPTDPGALVTGDGWLAGPYASIELGEGVFWDSSLLYGGSSNTVDTDFWDGAFDTTRWLLDTAITGQWRLDEVTTLTPRLRAVYLNEAVQSYTVENGTGNAIVIDGFASEQLQVSLGAEIARQFQLEDSSVLTPKLGVTTGVSGLDRSGPFGSVALGLNWQGFGGPSIDSGLLFNIDSSGGNSVGANVGISGSF